ncbi:MAG: PKD domain-containing protein [Bacteroidia bacterium]|nr:PKD domain-containing protein [Bacteroidia bacterium]
MKKLYIFVFAAFFTLGLTAQPIADFTFAYTNNGCASDSVVFTNLSTGAVFYDWDFGDGSPHSFDVNPYHIYTLQGNFTVILTAFDGFGGNDVESKTIIIQIIPNSWFWPDPNPSCPNITIEFQNFSWPIPVYTEWIFDDGDTAYTFNATHIYSYEDTFNVKLIAGNVCGTDTIINQVFVSDSAQPWIGGWANPNPACPNENIDFNANGSSDVISYKWFFGGGDSSLNQNTTHSYASIGIYNVSIIGFNSCSSDTSYFNVTIDNTIIPSVWSGADITTICPDDEVSFTGDGTNLINYYWDFDDGFSSTQQNPTHTFTNIGVYDVIFTGTNSCGNSNNDTIIINVTPLATPFASFNWNPWEPCPETMVSFTNNSSDTEYGVFWDFGDGYTSTDVNPIHAYDLLGNYNISLIVYNSCGNTDTAYNTISVVNDGVPLANFWSTPGPWQPMCMGTAVQFQNFSSDTTDVFWNFGDGFTSTEVNPVHVFDSTGFYTVTLTVTNNCGNSDSETSFQPYNIRDDIPPTADFWAWPTTVCPGEIVNVWNGSSDPNNSQWDFGDGYTSTEPQPTHSYTTSGNYNVTLIITNNCGADTMIRNITVKENSIADFNFTTECLGNPTLFTDLSSNAPESWGWDFGDGNSSSLQNPLNLYVLPGNYDVTLTVTKNGCSDDTIMTVPVYEVVADAGADIEICLGGTATLTATGGVSYLWSTTEITQSINVSPIADSTFYVTVTDIYGCTDIDSVSVTIGTLVAEAGPDQNICFGENAELTASGGIIYQWSTGETTASITVIPPFTSTYYVTVSDGFCFDDDSVTVFVNQVLADAGSDVDICKGQTTQLNASGGVDYEWFPTNLSNPYIANPFASPNVTTMYHVTVTDILGCTGTDSVTVNIIILNATVSGTNVTCNGFCDGTATANPSDGIPPYFYQWNDPFLQTTQTAVNLCNGVYNVTITDAIGCTKIKSIEIYQPNPLFVFISGFSDVTCWGLCNGTATAQGVGGTLPYSYQWNDPLSQNTKTADSLCMGFYNVIITDNNGCIANTNIFINEPPLLTVLADSTDATCNGLCNGTGFANFLGGTPPYSFLWSDGQTDQLAVNLCAGAYIVTVTDNNGCTASDSTVVNEPPLLVIIIDSIYNNSCNGASDGSIYCTTTGGTPGYNFVWTNTLQTTEDIINLTANIYDVTVTDWYGCTAINSGTVTEPNNYRTTGFG